MRGARGVGDRAGLVKQRPRVIGERSKNGTAVALSRRTTWWKQPTQNSASAHYITYITSTPRMFLPSRMSW
jgi:hypothetical protein